MEFDVTRSEVFPEKLSHDVLVWAERGERTARDEKRTARGERREAIGDRTARGERRTTNELRTRELEGTRELENATQGELGGTGRISEERADWRRKLLESGER